MPPLIGERPLSPAERQTRYRDRIRERVEVVQEAAAFVRSLSPDLLPPALRRNLVKLQHKLEAVQTQ